jgi:hypothetical protein
MKCIAKREEPKFEPLTLEITLESENEVNAFYALFNVMDICVVLREAGIEPEKVRNAIKNLLGNDYPDYGSVQYKLVSLLKSY